MAEQVTIYVVEKGYGIGPATVKAYEATKTAKLYKVAAAPGQWRRQFSVDEADETALAAAERFERQATFRVRTAELRLEDARTEHAKAHELLTRIASES